MARVIAGVGTYDTVAGVCREMGITPAAAVRLPVPEAEQAPPEAEQAPLRQPTEALPAVTGVRSGSGVSAR